MQLAMLPPIGDEEPLVRTYLEHFLRDAPNADAFADVLRPDYLRRVFAETKLLFGVGDAEQWYKMLTAAQRQVIRDRVELRLAPENPARFSTTEPTRLLVDLKNVQELVVRIYELNTASYYRTHDEPVDTDIDLDGLIATHEQTLSYHQPAVERHREQLELAEISGRGVWVIDLVGKGLRARRWFGAVPSTTSILTALTEWYLPSLTRIESQFPLRPCWLVRASSSRTIKGESCCRRSSTWFRAAPF